MELSTQRSQTTSLLTLKLVEFRQMGFNEQIEFLKQFRKQVRNAKLGKEFIKIGQVVRIELIKCKELKNMLILFRGAENALEIHSALKYNVNFKVFGASSKDDHCRHVFENYIGNIPFIHENGFIKAFNQVIKKNKIDIVFPSHDTVSLFLAENREKLSARIAVPDKETAQICRDKSQTYNVFKNHSFCLDRGVHLRKRK